ncbi:cardiolipin synthase [Halioglobus maricola]|nr:cardiolipin synthase [Halioglobus maricola]
MIAFIVALSFILGIVSAVHAILETRTPQGAIAWVVCLLVFPIVSVPAYWVLGRSRFHGYVNAWQEASDAIRKPLDEALEEFKPLQVQAPESMPEYAAITRLANFQFVTGNHTELLIDGQNTFESIEAGIEAATDYVLFQFYILRLDGVGNRFKEQLIRKAREGVKVLVLYDELGSSSLAKENAASLVAPNISVRPFNTRQGRRNRFQLNFRNHRKIVVVDGRVAWLGGLNVGDDYLGLDPKLSPWRDTHMRIEGPAAVTAQAIFVSDWYWAAREFLDFLSWRPYPTEAAGKPALVLGSGPADELETASLFFTTVLNLARERIWIATPYFIPDEATMVALRLALLRGTEVRILTPRLNDNWFVRQAANVYLSELADMGARIFFYEKGFMHQKVVLIDSAAAIIGTVNFDNRSFRLNFEVSGAVADSEFANQVETMLEQDFGNSTEASDYRLRDQPFLDRLQARTAALLAPVL